MGRIAYVNGRYLPHGEAVVHVEDRGFQFADGVYEYFAVFDGSWPTPTGISSGSGAQLHRKSRSARR